MILGLLATATMCAVVLATYVLIILFENLIKRHTGTPAAEESRQKEHHDSGNQKR